MARYKAIAKDKRSKKLTIVDLNDDVLLEICDQIDASRRQYNHRPKTLKNLTLTCRRFRAVAQPLVLSRLAVLGSWKVHADAAKDLLKNKAICEHARYI